MSKSIVISSGHGKYVRGASGYLDEVDEARKVVEQVAQDLRSAGVTVKTFHDDTSDDQSENLSTIVNYHNKQSRDLDVSVHFNAYQTTSKPMGCECLYVTQSELSADLAKAMATAQSLPNRGGKYRGDLYFLNNTHEPAVLLEVCFVDSSTDAEHYENAFDEVCRVIAETLCGQPIGAPIEPPVEPVEPEEPSPSPETPVVEFTIKATGRVNVIINGHMIEIDVSGIPANQRDIITTVFGGAGDPNHSAYGGDEFLNDTDLYVAMPWKFTGERPQVKVYNRETGKSAVGEIMDVGPWFIDDAYWDTGLRPLAEVCYMNGTECPRGPNEGKVPNGAGIDVSPGMAKALGFSGKAIVDWHFLD